MGRLRFRTAIAVLAAIPTGGFGQDANMMQAEAALWQAVTNADRSALENVLDSDFTWTNSTGRVLTKAQVLAELPKMAIAPAQNAEREVYGYGELGDVQLGRGGTHLLLVLV